MGGLIHTLRLRVRALLKRRQLDRDLQDEIACHLELRGHEEQPRAPFGNVTSVREQCRDVWTFLSIENAWRELRHAVRVLRRAPVHSLITVMLLALGIGTNTAMFTLVNALFI